MARRPALVLLAVLVAANVAAGGPGCDFHEWKCGSGECIFGSYRCNGERDCSDGSDEAAGVCDKVPSVRMRVGQVVTVRTEYGAEHGHVVFDLCNETSCIELWLISRTAGGAMGFAAFTGCNASGRGGNLHHEDYPDGWQNFQAGQLVFRAERRPAELAVWLDGYKDNAVTVPVAEGSDLLRVRPWYWTSDMPVRFEPDAVVELNETSSTRGPIATTSGGNGHSDPDEGNNSRGSSADRT